MHSILYFSNKILYRASIRSKQAFPDALSCGDCHSSKTIIRRLVAIYTSVYQTSQKTFWFETLFLKKSLKSYSESKTVATKSQWSGDKIWMLYEWMKLLAIKEVLYILYLVLKLTIWHSGYMVNLLNPFSKALTFTVLFMINYNWFFHIKLPITFHPYLQ